MYMHACTPDNPQSLWLETNECFVVFYFISICTLLFSLWDPLDDLKFLTFSLPHIIHIFSVSCSRFKFLFLLHHLKFIYINNNISFEATTLHKTTLHTAHTHTHTHKGKHNKTDIAAKAFRVFLQFCISFSMHIFYLVQF